MAKRSVGLHRPILWCLAITGAVAVVIVLCWYFLLNALISTGFVYPASEGWTRARSVSEQQAFDPDALAGLVRYAHFAPDGSLIGTDMDEGTLAAAQGNPTGGDWLRADFADGSWAVLHWRYLAEFVNPQLRSALPPFELLWLGGMVLALGLCLYLSARVLRRKLAAKLAVMVDVSRRIGARELDFVAPPTGIREFDDVLKSLTEMRDALKDSLSAQWKLEQDRERQVSALAHDLKTPLALISGSAELLLEDQLTPEQHMLAEGIQRGAGRAQDYLSQLSSVAYGEPSTEPFSDVDPAALVASLRSGIEPLAQQKRIRIEWDLSLSDPFRAQPVALERALMNLLENAIHHTPEGGVITFTAQHREPHSAPTFSVQDAGPGFTAAALRHAKERFWQDDTSRADPTHRGLGLWIADDTAQKQGGQLTLKNTPTGGLVTLAVQTDGTASMDREEFMSPQ